MRATERQRGSGQLLRRRPAVAGERNERGGVMAIFIDQDTKVVVQGLTGGQGRFHGLRNRDYGTQVVAGVTPGKGGQDVDGDPRLRLRGRSGRRHRRRCLVRRRPAEGGAGGDPRSGGRRHPLRRVHHRGHPGARRGPGVQHPPAPVPADPAARPELPGRDQPGKVQHRHHRGRHRPRRPPPTGPTSASSAAPGRSPTRRCTSSRRTASACPRAWASAATRCRGPASSTAWPSSRPIPRPTPCS